MFTYHLVLTNDNGFFSYKTDSADCAMELVTQFMNSLKCFTLAMSYEHVNIESVTYTVSQGVMRRVV